MIVAGHARGQRIEVLGRVLHQEKIGTLPLEQGCNVVHRRTFEAQQIPAADPHLFLVFFTFSISARGERAAAVL
jgi:hypothetical protein